MILSLEEVDQLVYGVYNLDVKKDQACCYHLAKIWQQPSREFSLSHWRLSAGLGFLTMENSDGRYCGQAWSLVVFLLALIVLRLPGARQQLKVCFLFLALEN